MQEYETKFHYRRLGKYSTIHHIPQTLMPVIFVIFGISTLKYVYV